MEIRYTATNHGKRRHYRPNDSGYSLTLCLYHSNDERMNSPKLREASICPRCDKFQKDQGYVLV